MYFLFIFSPNCVIFINRYTEASLANLGKLMEVMARGGGDADGDAEGGRDADGDAVGGNGDS